MRCAKCGFNNTNGANFCSNCGAALKANPTPKPPRQTKNRKVVKLPSDHSDKVATPNERPWEVRVSAHDDAAHETAEANPRREHHTATTGRIPAIKRPRYESGKIPPEERAGARRDAGASAATAHTSAGRSAVAAGTAMFGGAAADANPSDTTPIVLDDYEISSYAGEGTRASFGTSRGATPQRRSIRSEVEAYANPTESGGKRRLLILIIAILVICCLVAFGIFMAGSGDSARTVRFDTDGGTVIGNQYIDEDGTLARPANPTRPGYVFDGWYLDANYDEEAEFPLDVTQDMTLYAKWREEKASTSTPSITTPDASGTLPTLPSDDSNANSTGSSSTGSTGGSGSNAGSGSAGATRPSPGTGSGNASSGATGGNTGGSANAGDASTGANDVNAGTSTDVNTNTASNGPVDITLIAANGTPLSGTVNLHDGYVIPDSSDRAYSVDELRALGLNDAELCIARNEPYARQGYSFMNPGLQAYFNARSWYHNSGRRFELPANSAGYITAHNLLTLAEQTPGAAAWLRLRTR